MDTLNLIFYVLLVGKPSNIAFKILFTKYQPTSKKKMDTITGAGSMIGFRAFGDWGLSRLWTICFDRASLYSQVHRPLQ